MFGQPLSLLGVYSSILNVNFRSKMKRMCPLTKKIAQQAWKIAQTCLRSLRVFPSMLPPSSWIVFVWRQIEWIIQTMGFPIGNLQWSVEAIGVDNGDHTEVHLWSTVTCGEYSLNVNLIASFNIVPHVRGLWHFVILQICRQTFYHFSSGKLIRCL